ncbi:MAG TPA: hypothetical protein RMH99_31215, partial [Sandaracinaceae bacterium LLY-WYZ-13_1]|nr:hypothetical protein [Sandaracinaceae bacterium LLY-WYZ-13_1]
ERGRAPERIVGTPLYMAPEMVVGSVPDARTDVYLLGATLHEVLTGEPPHRAAHLHASMMHAYESPPPEPEYGPEVPPELAALCRRAMARAPADRFPSARALREAIRDYRTHRAAITLCREAQARAEELQPLLGDRDADAEQLAHLEAEARFGFRQALREWPDHTEARRGLANLARSLAERELSLGHPRGARRYLADMPKGDAALEARIEAAEEARRREAEAEERRRERERQLDVRNAHRERVAMYGLGGLLTAGVAVWRTVSPATLGDVAARHQQLLTVALVLSALMTLVAAAARRRLFTSELNRHLSLALLGVGAAMVLNRLTGVLLLPPPEVTMAADLAAFTVGVLSMTRLISGLFAFSAVPYVAGIALLWRFPERQALIFNGVCVASWVFMAFAFVRARRAAASSDHAATRPAGAPRSDGQKQV